MTRDLYRTLCARLPQGRRLLGTVVLASTLAGMLEAALLVLTVKAGLQLTEGPEGRVQVGLAGVALSLSVSQALVAAAATGVAGALCNVLVAHLRAAGAAAMLLETRAQVLEEFSVATWETQQRLREGALQETVSSQAQQAAMLVLYFVAGVSGAVFLAVFLAIALAVDLVATLMVVSAGALLFAALRPITKLTSTYAGAFVAANRNFGESVAEYSNLLIEQRTFGVEATLVQRLRAVASEAAAKGYKAQFASQTGFSLYRSGAMLSLVLAVAALHSVVQVDLGSVGAVVVLMLRCLGYSQQVQLAVQQINQLEPNLRDIQHEVERLGAARVVGGTERLDSISSLEAVGVWYRYPGEPRHALQDISVRAVKGEVLGIVGPSGGGKSTLAQVLVGLRRASAGEICVDGSLRLADISRDDWTSEVAFVAQEPHLIEDTIAANIRFFRQGLSIEDVVCAAHLAGLYEEIIALPEGFDTPLGPRGSGLSGGQAQRLAIARALAGRPSVLVMDEPTSALDKRAEEAVCRAIAELREEMIIVVVAHRSTTIGACDRIVRVVDGVLAADPRSRPHREPE